MLFNFSLWAGLLLLSADAAPHSRFNSGTVTLPLKRLEQRSDAHPQIVSGSFILLQHSRNHRLRRPTNKISTAATVAMRE
jgi:hypothetical protein